MMMSPRIVPVFGLLVLLVLPGCGGSTPNDSAAAGTGTVDGKVDGRAFTTVAASYVIGKPDDPAKTIVAYVFDRPVGCSAIDAPGWDERLADETQSLELKLIGKTPATFPVAADHRPSAGESTDNYTLTATTGTPSEVSATDGQVVLDTFASQDSATGSFGLTFPGGRLDGTFHAAWCAGGTEP